MNISRRELVVLLISALILGLVFGFDDGRPSFEAWPWLSHMMGMAFIGLILVITYTSAQKIIGERIGCDVELEFWNFKAFSLKKPPQLHEKKGIPFLFGVDVWIEKNFGAILPIMLVAVSKGAIKCAAVISSKIEANESKRLGRKYAKWSEFDEAKIAVSGPIAVIALALLIKTFLDVSNMTDQMMTMAKFLALWSMLPLPGLDGFKVFFGSPLLYIFCLILVIMVVLLANVIAPIWTAILALVSALTVFLIYYNAKFVKA